MHAAQHADVSILKLLLDRGAAKDAVDAGGWNAADYALAARQDGNAAFLRSIGVRSLVVEAEQARAAMFDRCNRAVEGVKDEKERVQTMAACLREHQSDLK